MVVARKQEIHGRTQRVEVARPSTRVGSRPVRVRDSRVSRGSLQTQYLVDAYRLRPTGQFQSRILFPRGDRATSLQA